MYLKKEKDKIMKLKNIHLLSFFLMLACTAYAKTQLIIRPLSTDTQKPILLQFVYHQEHKQMIIDKNKKIFDLPVFDLASNDTLRLEFYDGYLILFSIDIINENNMLTMKLFDSTYTQLAYSTTTLNSQYNYDILFPLIAATEIVDGKKVIRPSDQTINAVKKPEIIEKNNL